MNEHPIISVATDIHGRYHLNVGTRKYMYNTAAELALGIVYHTNVSPKGVERDKMIAILTSQEETNKVIERAVAAVKHELKGANARCKRYVEKNAELRATIKQYQKQFGKL